MNSLRCIVAIVFFTILAALPARAQLVINEVSNGTTGAQEYVELLVVGTPTCTTTCVDLRGWVIDDNNGTFATGSGTGIAGGHMSFASSATWQCVPIGTLIVIYNNNDRNPAIPADNLTGANCRYVIPASSNLFERNTTEPSVGGVATYGGPYVSGGDWAGQGLSNSDDSYQTRAPGALGVPYHAVSYGSNTNNTIIYFAGSGGGLVFSMTNNVSNDPAVQANWTSASAATGQTPGAANNTANATWINSLNNNCSPNASVQVTLGPDLAICPGDSITIRATASTTGVFSWPGFPANNTDSIRIAPTAPIGIIVNFNGGAGCTAADTVSINIIAPPTGAIAGNTTVCAGQSTTLTASGGASYQWSTNETTPAITVSPAVNTTYTVTVTNAGGCRDTVSAIVNVNALPNGTVTGNTTLCIGTGTTLTASGGSTYLWSTNEATAAISVAPLVNTPYSVTITDANGCRDTVTTAVTVNAQPNGAITGNTAICAGASTLLTASGGGTYLWSTNETTAAITVSPAVNTTYTVTITDASGCRDTVSSTVNIATAVSGNIAGNLTICTGQSTTLTASGGNTYSWSNGFNIDSIIVSPAATTTYTVTVTSGNCADTISATVTVNTQPTGSIAGDLDICVGETTTLTATGGSSYLWSNNQTTTLITVSPVSNTTYSVTVTGANGCLDTVSAAVTVNQLPVANARPDTIICSGNNVELRASSGSTYLWSTGASTANITVNPNVTTDYFVTVTSTANCSAVDTVTITVNPNNIVLAVDSVVTETCGQANGQIVLQSPSNFVTYVLLQNGVRIDSVLGGGIFFDLVGGTYDITATDNNGCQRSITGVVVPSTLVPQATVEATGTSCFGIADGQLIVSSATNGLYYSLNGGIPQQSDTFSGLAAGQYTVRIIDSIAGCSNVITATIVSPDVLAVSVLPDSANIIIGAAIDLVSNTTGGTPVYSYTWSPITALNCDTCATVTATPQDSINVYILTVTDANGCIDTARVVVRATNEFLITVPTGFTPNGDGWNDFLRPLSNEPIDFNLMVFNRWGEKIYEGDGMPGWNGTYKNEKQPLATYVYVIEYTRLLNGKKGYLTGSITLLR